MSQAAAATLAERGFPVSGTPADKEKLFKHLANLADDSRRRNFLSQNQELLRSEIVSEISDHVREQVRVDVQQALHLAEVALIIAQEIVEAEGNSWRLARLEINIGNIYYRQDRFADALGCYERAYRGLLNQKDEEGIAAVLSNMATCHISLNAFPKALETYQRAREFC